MGKNLNELEYVEQELEDLRSHLQQSFAVLHGLAKAQAQFEELARTYKHLKDHLEEIEVNREQLSRLEANFNQRFTTIEQAIESKSQESKSELSSVQQELNNADITLSNYNAEIAKQVSEVRQDIDERFNYFLNEWATYKKGITAPFDELIDSKLDQELEVFKKQLSSTGFNKHLEKQQRLEAQLNLTTSSLDEVDRQVHNLEKKLSKAERQLRVMNKWLIVSVLVTVLCVGLVFALLLVYGGPQ